MLLNRSVGAALAFVAIRRRRLARALLVASGAAVLGGCGLMDSGGAGAREGGFDRRVYVGGGVLVSQLEPDADDAPSLRVDEDRSAGGSLALGYDLSERFSVEGHIASLGEATFDPDGDIAYQVGGLSGLLHGFGDADDRRAREGFSAFGRLGVGTMRNQADDVEFERVNDIHVLVGAGLEYGFTNGLAVRGELVAHEADARYAQLGALYRFGKARTHVPPASSETPGAPTAPTSRAAVTPAPAAAPSTARALDGDADGVPDTNDACADTGSGHPVDERGCDLLDGPIAGITFESGSDALASGAEEVLAGVAATLREYPLVDVSIDAHTDNRGSAANNLELSRRRVLSVARFLVGEGVEPGRLEPRAFGESRPIASNATAGGRASNRRIEFSVAE